MSGGGGGEEETDSTLIFGKFQTVIKTEPNRIFLFCKLHFVKLIVIFAMHVRVNDISQKNSHRKLLKSSHFAPVRYISKRLLRSPCRKDRAATAAALKEIINLNIPLHNKHCRTSQSHTLKNRGLGTIFFKNMDF